MVTTGPEACTILDNLSTGVAISYLGWKHECMERYACEGRAL